MPTPSQSQFVRRLLLVAAWAFLVSFAPLQMLFAQTSTWKRYVYNDFDSVQRSVICTDAAGNVWAINALGSVPGAYGVSRFDGVTFRVYGVADGLSCDTLFCITRDREGRIWVGGRRCLAFYNPETDRWSSIQRQDALASVRDFLHIACDSSNHIWVAAQPKIIIRVLPGGAQFRTVSELHEWDGHAWTVYDYKAIANDTADDAGSVIQDLTVAPDGSVWVVATQVPLGGGRFAQGLTRYKNSEWKHFNLGGIINAEGLNGVRQPSCVVCDRFGRVYTGYGFRPAFDIFDSKTETWSTDTSVRIDRGRATSMLTDPYGRPMVVGFFPPGLDSTGHTINTGASGAYVLDGFKPIEEIHDEGVYAGAHLAFSTDGVLWVASAQELSKYTSIFGVKSISVPLLSASSWPNPATDHLTLRYNLKTSGKVTITLRSVLGAMVQTLASEQQDAGDHEFRVSDLALPSGSYELSIENFPSESSRMSRATLPITILR